MFYCHGVNCWVSIIPTRIESFHWKQYSSLRIARSVFCYQGLSTVYWVYEVQDLHSCDECVGCAGGHPTAATAVVVAAAGGAAETEATSLPLARALCFCLSLYRYPASVGWSAAVCVVARCGLPLLPPAPSRAPHTRCCRWMVTPTLCSFVPSAPAHLQSFVPLQPAN